MARKAGATIVSGYHSDPVSNPRTGNRQPSVRAIAGSQPLSRGDDVCKHLRMEPFGDPEARIRDLERPLADRAEASEMGTRSYEAVPTADMPAPPYPYTAPPPPPGPVPGPPFPQQYGAQQYGSPYYSPPQQVVHKRPQTMVWVLLAVAIGIVTTGIIGVSVFSNLGNTIGSSPRPAAPGISGGGGSVDTPDVQIPTPGGAPSAQVPFDPNADVVTVEAGDTLSFGGVEQHKTIVCNQGTVNISGMTNTIEIQGDCASVSVSGMDNTITVESARTLSASGFDNKVTYRTGDPQISTSGTGNTIEQG